MEGNSLVKICEGKGMPNRSTIIRWQTTNEDFATRCARAREMQADLMDDKILDVADNSTTETAAADRVKISAYQWRASKLAPKKYGDKLDLTSADGSMSPKPAIDVSKLSTETLAEIMRATDATKSG